jgi:hypothetical protein
MQVLLLPIVTSPAVLQSLPLKTRHSPQIVMLFQDYEYARDTLQVMRSSRVVDQSSVPATNKGAKDFIVFSSKPILMILTIYDHY